MVAPSNFVSVSGGTASVHGYGTTAGETAFYQTFTVAGGVLATGTYTWSATIANVTDASATMFIKVWDTDAFLGFKGDKHQNVPLMNWQSVDTKVGDGGTLTLGTNAAAISLGFFRLVTP